MLTTLRRLWQPRHPLFWLMLGFNVLSSVCGWALQALPLNTLGLLLLSCVVLLNGVFGLLVAWKLVHEGQRQGSPRVTPAPPRTTP